MGGCAAPLQFSLFSLLSVFKVLQCLLSLYSNCLLFSPNVFAVDLNIKKICEGEKLLSSSIYKLSDKTTFSAYLFILYLLFSVKI